MRPGDRRQLHLVAMSLYAPLPRPRRRFGSAVALLVLGALVLFLVGALIN
jgi:hypothetical protein